MRYALYCTPPANHPLLSAIEPWLGRSVVGNAVMTDPGPFSPDEHQALTGSRARYGFHATLKAPYHLAEGYREDHMVQILIAFASRHGPVNVGQLRVTRMGDYLALMPLHQTQELTQFAQHVVEAFEPTRGPLSEDEYRRRNRPGLTARQKQLLDKWGYSSTQEEFKFHMTLAGPSNAELLDRAQTYLSELLAPVLEEPFLLDTLGVFWEDQTPGPFHVKRLATLSQNTGQ